MQTPKRETVKNLSLTIIDSSRRYKALLHYKSLR